MEESGSRPEYRNASGLSADERAMVEQTRQARRERRQDRLAPDDEPVQPLSKELLYRAIGLMPEDDEL